MSAGPAPESLPSHRPARVPRYFLTRRLFLRGLGVVYLVAFGSLSTQVVGLSGSKGINPAGLYLDRIQENLGGESYWRVPTILYLSHSDAALQATCYGGAVLAAVLVLYVLPGPILLLLWVFYLSLCSVCTPFLNFQWDILLLETGFLAIFWAPWRLRPRRDREPRPSRIMLWLLRLLLFKLMFMSGVVKIQADENWRNLSALSYHYETQPLPTTLAWYVHHWPRWFHQLSVSLTLGIELIVPFAIFLPRLFRKIAFFVFVLFQLLIMLTGNYTFFNLLTILLCVVLVDDQFWSKLLPARLMPAGRSEEQDASNSVGLQEQPAADAAPKPEAPPHERPGCTAILKTVLRAVVAGFLATASGTLMVQRLCLDRAQSRTVERYVHWIRPFRSINTYGLFAHMTTGRPEIIIEGSDDGRNWEAYEFKWKPGDLARRPQFVAPHQPRLDWQMWFAALSNYRRQPWLVDFAKRLLEGAPEVTGLLQHNPFDNHPPRYIRALVYDYHFTSPEEQSEAGRWWTRDHARLYLPPMKLRQ